MMKKFLSVFVMLYSISATSQDKIIKVWPETIPGAISDPEIKENVNKENIMWITQVTKPTISVFLPSKEKSTGTAVVICPGGGYGGLAFDYEGLEFGAWFKEMGVVGIVLKYSALLNITPFIFLFLKGY